MPGPGEAVTPSAPPNDGADGGADRGDLVLGLERDDAELLVPASSSRIDDAGVIG